VSGIHPAKTTWPGPAIDERAAQVDANGAVTYIHTDWQSSVIALSDSAGNVTSRRACRAYGDVATPHVQRYERHYDVRRGMYFVRPAQDVRSAFWWEVPR
jgi:hypothetical protein